MGSEVARESRASWGSRRRANRRLPSPYRLPPGPNAKAHPRRPLVRRSIPNNSNAAAVGCSDLLGRLTSIHHQHDELHDLSAANHGIAHLAAKVSPSITTSVVFPQLVACTHVLFGPRGIHFKCR